MEGLGDEVPCRLSWRRSSENTITAGGNVPLCEKSTLNTRDARRLSAWSARWRVLSRSVPVVSLAAVGQVDSRPPIEILDFSLTIFRHYVILESPALNLDNLIRQPQQPTTNSNNQQRLEYSDCSSRLQQTAKRCQKERKK